MTIPQRSIKPEHIDLKAVRTEHLQVASSGGINLGNFSTTDTSQYFTVGSYDLHVPTPQAMIWTPFQLHVAHSVHAGQHSVFVGLYTQGGGSLLQTLYWAVQCGTVRDVGAGLWPWTSHTGVGVGYLTPNLTSGGTYSLYILVKNETTGTLFYGQSGNASDFLTHFITGF